MSKIQQFDMLTGTAISGSSDPFGFSLLSWNTVKSGVVSSSEVNGTQHEWKLD